MLGLPGFIIPFVYVYNPALLIVDTPVLDTVWIVILATFAVVLMSMAVIGWFKGKLNPGVPLRHGRCGCPDVRPWHHF